MMSMKALIKPLSAMMLSVWLSPAFADSKEVTCESSHNNRSYCPTGRHGDVKLMKQLGWSSCDEGKSWGVETEGIWVDDGCRARFWVEAEGHDKKKDHTGAIVAGVAGAALLGALLLSNSGASSSESKETTQSEQVPSDLVGRFEGYDPHEKVDVELQIHNNGRVTANAGRHRSEGRYEGGFLRFDGGHEYRLEKTHRGVRLFNTHDSNNVVDMSKL